MLTTNPIGQISATLVARTAVSLVALFTLLTPYATLPSASHFIHDRHHPPSDQREGPMWLLTSFLNNERAYDAVYFTEEIVGPIKTRRPKAGEKHENSCERLPVMFEATTIWCEWRYQWLELPQGQARVSSRQISCQADRKVGGNDGVSCNGVPLTNTANPSDAYHVNEPVSTGGIHKADSQYA